MPHLVFNSVNTLNSLQSCNYRQGTKRKIRKMILKAQALKKAQMNDESKSMLVLVGVEAESMVPELLSLLHAALGRSRLIEKSHIAYINALCFASKHYSFSLILTHFSPVSTLFF